MRSPEELNAIMTKYNLKPQSGPGAVPTPTPTPTNPYAGLRGKDLVDALNKSDMGISGPVEPQNFLEKASNVVQKGVGYVAKAADVTGLPYVVGGAAGALGGAIGGTVAAIGTPIANKLKGRPLTENLGHNIAQNATDTAKLGYEVGKGGTEVAPLGALGRIPSAVVGAQQTYQGVKDIYGAVKNKDIVQGAQGATELVGGLLGAKGAYEGGLSTKGLLANPDVVESIKTLPESARARAANTIHEKTVKSYKEILNQTPKELQSEVKWEKNTPQFLADKGIILKQGENGRLDHTEAVNELKSQSEPLNDNLTQKLKQFPKQFNLKQLFHDAVKQIKKNVDGPAISALEKDKMIAGIKDFVGAEMAHNRENLLEQGHNPTDEEGLAEKSAIVDGAKLNEIKKGAWNTAFDQNNKVGNSAIYSFGHTIKNAIEQAYKDNVDVEGLNKEIGDYASATRFLEKSSGRAMRGSFFGKLFNKGIGVIAGEAVGGPLGAIAGSYVGGKVSEALNNPSTKTKILQGLKSKVGSPKGK